MIDINKDYISEIDMSYHSIHYILYILNVFFRKHRYFVGYDTSTIET